MKRFVEFINTSSEVLSKELIATEAKFFVPGQKEPLEGPTGYLNIINMMRSGFSDIQWELEDMVAEDNQIAARFTMRGTHDGLFFNVPATFRTIEVKAVNFYKFYNDQIIEEFGQPDLLNLLQQIGALPSMN
ncbi:conserved hypothetical protein, steroid delta-isomerase-related [Mucilaginibacter polytrichastri]|nr:conserved hypothetical protein, steroid delta-isomerase-related [Mucilaginibacter polytrichastri]